MSHRLFFAVLLGVLVTVGSALPGQGLVRHAAAASCSSWSSNSQPPPTIRVFRHVTGTVDTVDFKAYTKNVLSREWISSWTTESLRSGALAVKNYAWYQVLHWRGGTNADGECFDLRDDTWDQVYDPSKATYATAAAAVDDTWDTLVLKNGAIFPTYYNAGDVGEACGANANGWKAFQWGTQGCGVAGLSAGQIILTYYYPNVTVTGPGATPAPTATPAPSATPTPAPTASQTASPSPQVTPAPTQTPSPTPAATAAPSGTAAPTPSPTPLPTAAPTPSPTPLPTAAPTPATTPTPSPAPTATPLPPPPPDQQLPGGGQSGVEGAVAPPPPPPEAPDPTVALPDAGPDPTGSVSEVARELRWAAVMRRLAWLDALQDDRQAQFAAAHREAGMHAAAGVTVVRIGGSEDAESINDVRVAAFVITWDRAVRDLMAALGRQLRPVLTASRAGDAAR
jgi:hypothetical protein